MRKISIVLLLATLLLSAAATGRPSDEPYWAVQIGGVAGLLPALNGSVQLGALYVTEALELTAESIFNVFPNFGFYQRLGLTFFPGEMAVGAIAGFAVDPFVLAESNVWAETAVLDTYLGESDSLLTGIAGTELWLGGRFGGELYFRAIADLAGDVPLSATSITSVTYDQMRGLGLEEEIDLRVRFNAPKFSTGQLLTGSDLSPLATHVTARCRLDRNGFALTGVVAGFELEFRHPLSPGEDDE